jgi:Skp family chaperone for outer membrane proteins
MKNFLVIAFMGLVLMLASTFQPTAQKGIEQSGIVLTNEAGYTSDAINTGTDVIAASYEFAANVVFKNADNLAVITAPSLIPVDYCDPPVISAGIGGLLSGGDDGEGGAWNTVVNIVLLVLSLVLGTKFTALKVKATQEGTKYNSKLQTAQRLFAAVIDSIKDDNKIDATEKARIEALWAELIGKPDDTPKQ